VDLSFAIIPWFILRKLEMGPEEKVGVAVAMSMGIFAAVCAFIKASTLPELANIDFSCMSGTFSASRGPAANQAPQIPPSPSLSGVQLRSP
jgi:hypothetical protein